MEYGIEENVYELIYPAKNAEIRGGIFKKWVLSAESEERRRGGMKNIYGDWNKYNP